MRKFAHIGLLTTSPMPGESWFPTLKCWATDPANDPNQVEWVRLAPDCLFWGTPVAEGPHTTWAVDDLDAELEGKHVVFGPHEVAPGIRIAYFIDDGAVCEYMEVKA